MEFQILIRKIQGNLSREEEAEFEQWYRASEENRKYFSRVQEGYQQQLPTKVAPKKAWQDLDRRLFAAKRKRLRAAMAVAAAFIGLFGIFLFTGSPAAVEPQITTAKEETDSKVEGIVFIDEQGKEQVLDQNTVLEEGQYQAAEKTLKLTGDSEKKAKIQTLIVPRGEQLTVELADGTRVWLNSDTRISFPSHFKGRETREVQMAYGEAYFEISPCNLHDGKEFTVRNKEQLITVLGTKFNIRAYPEAAALATTLVEGSVQLEAGDTDIRMIPGQQASVGKTDRTVEVRKVDVDKELAWLQGKYIFEEEALGEIMLVLGRWYDVKVEFSEEGLQQQQFNGVLNKNQKIEEIIEILTNTKKVTFELNGRKLVVKP